MRSFCIHQTFIWENCELILNAMLQKLQIIKAKLKKTLALATANFDCICFNLLSMHCTLSQQVIPMLSHRLELFTVRIVEGSFFSSAR